MLQEEPIPCELGLLNERITPWSFLTQPDKRRTWNAFVSCFMVTQVRFFVPPLVRARQNALQKVIP